MAPLDARISARARALLLAAAVLLGLPALTMPWTDDERRAEWENRSLAELPIPGGQAADGAGYFAALGAWIEDHFGLALKMSRLHRRIVFYVFRDSPAPQISIGRGGFVFLNSHDASRPFHSIGALCDTRAAGRRYDALVDAWMQVLEHFQERGRNVVLAIAPTKPVVYPDRLPSSVPAAIRDACLAYRESDPPIMRLVADARARGLKALYPLDAFIADRMDGNFYPKESFHFSGQSAQLFARTLMEAVGIDSGAIDEAPRYAARTKADLKEIVGFNRRVDSMQIDYTAFGIQLERGQPALVRSCYARAMDFGTYKTATPLTERDAVIISDSFGNFTAAQLAPAYRRLVWININDLQDEEGAGFLTHCLARIPAQDLFLVFHDGGALGEGQLLRRRLLGVEE